MISAPKPEEWKATALPAKVLIVDDDPALCEFIQEVLLAEKMQPHVITDSLQAAVRIQKEKFEAIFLDMRMPSLDGIGLAKHIKSSGLNSSTPLVMISGDEDRQTMQRAFQSGISLFLFKPVDRLKLVRLLHSVDNYIQVQRRRFLRIKTSKNVSMESGDLKINGTSLDLSVGGMFVQSSNTFPVGSNVRVGLELQAGKPPLQFSARVARVCGKDCMGLKIESSSQEETKCLEDFLLPLMNSHFDS